MDVGLLGFGRFGRALGMLLAEAGVDFRACDDAAAIDPAQRASIDEIARADLIILAVPVLSLRAALASLRPHLDGRAVLADVGSVKVAAVRAFEDTIGGAAPWVGTHPLFGPMSLARAERPLRVVVCRGPRHPDAAARVIALWERIGCEVIEQSPEAHDRVMAYTHALTYFVAKGMMDAGADLDVPFAPPSFQALARTIETVRSDAGHLFSAVQAENPFAPEARRALLDALARIDDALARAEPAADTSDAALAIPDLGARSPALREARDHIDAIDREIVALLGRRAQLARRAARAKAALGHPVLDPSRESALLAERRRWADEAGLDGEAVDAIFRAVLAFSRHVQQFDRSNDR